MQIGPKRPLLKPAVVDSNLSRREQLLLEVGARVRNVIDDPTIACPRCGGADVGVCRPCRDLIAMGQAADRVIPLVYAASQTQIRADLRNYKETRLLSTQQSTALRSLQALMWNFSYRHEACLTAVSALPPTLTMAVPSGSPRTDPHPFEEIARLAPAAWTRADAIREYPILRTCDPASISFNSPRDFSGEHVVVLDDSWVTGSKAEGVAMAAKRDGAAEVTVITLARIVNSTYGPAAPLLAHIDGKPFDKFVCPVTRGACP